ncbi:TetR/AcrR family transcriptional regulator [Nocardia australiensis]|uniref:TetR/AcrR family transcriptional regulator n=1 Tax=Nocardia australiensis TaxID=2887191 RepID=UPI001D134F7F|nr:TetR/AcrR family transcriptional regulator [Nocardia australiensis]
MTRTTGERAPETSRERVLDAAARLFAAHGFHGASMRDIAEQVGMRAASLYNHFPGKDDMLVAIGDRYFAELAPKLGAIAERDGDALERLSEMVACAVEVALAAPYEHLTLARDIRLFRDDPRFAEVLEIGRTCTKHWRTVLNQGIQAGAVRRDVPASDAIWIVYTSITGLVERGFRDGILDQRSPRSAPALRAVLIDGLRSQEK